MASVVLKVDPERLKNRSLDIRYVLPDVIAAESGGNIEDDGYDYASDNRCLLLYLKVSDIDRGLSCISDIIQNRTVLENTLTDAVTVAVEDGGNYVVVFPPGNGGALTM